MTNDCADILAVITEKILNPRCFPAEIPESSNTTIQFHFNEAWELCFWEIFHFANDQLKKGDTSTMNNHTPLIFLQDFLLETLQGKGLKDYML